MSVKLNRVTINKIIKKFPTLYLPLLTYYKTIQSKIALFTTNEKYIQRKFTLINVT